MAKRNQKRQESSGSSIKNEKASPSIGEIKHRRRELSNLRMLTSLAGEGSYAIKNVLDHAVDWSERGRTVIASGGLSANSMASVLLCWTSPHRRL